MSAVRVLLVEDDASWVELTTQALAEVAADVELTVARSVPAAWVLLSEQPRPDLVLLDLNLPGMDGRDLLERMVARSAFVGTRVVVVSASTSPADRELVLSRGASEYHVKPSRFSELVALLGGVLAAGRTAAPSQA